MNEAHNDKRGSVVMHVCSCIYSAHVRACGAANTATNTTFEGLPCESPRSHVMKYVMSSAPAARRQAARRCDAAGALVDGVFGASRRAAHRATCQAPGKPRARYCSYLASCLDAQPDEWKLQPLARSGRMCAKSSRARLSKHQAALMLNQYWNQPKCSKPSFLAPLPQPHSTRKRFNRRQTEPR